MCRQKAIGRLGEESVGHVHQAGGGRSWASPKQIPWPVPAEAASRLEGSRHRVSSTQASLPSRWALTA